MLVVKFCPGGFIGAKLFARLAPAGWFSAPHWIHEYVKRFFPHTTFAKLSDYFPLGTFIYPMFFSASHRSAVFFNLSAPPQLRPSSASLWWPPFRENVVAQNIFNILGSPLLYLRKSSWMHRSRRAQKYAPNHVYP